MKISEYYQSNETPVLSLELNLKNGLDDQTIAQLQHCQQVTYFSLVNHSDTMEAWSEKIRQAGQIQAILQKPVLLHFPAAGLTEDNLSQLKQELQVAHIENLLVLRGDGWRPSHNYKTPDLLAALAQDFDLAATINPGAPTEEIIIDAQRKQSAGASYLISQAFFDNAEFDRTQHVLKAADLNLPLVAGLFYFPSTDDFQALMARFKMTEEKYDYPAHFFTQVETLKSAGIHLFAPHPDQKIWNWLQSDYKGHKSL
ncbi:methylenetetrahydrofolate reductase [Eupransor demetentiae]|uniref:Methylenetetrahydrofolate reductase n=1 Tax=Eupransor demetentiae TaxID=3109584 RepID=A0ABP0ETN9_9LACO|nr:5 [Lactobacillaceae bacterium LMG 33000] [Lactobacillaceae bacterium LMG 33000]